MAFDDVKSNEYYFNAATWAKRMGMVSGNKFEPKTPCTRGQIVTFLKRALSIENSDDAKKDDTKVTEKTDDKKTEDTKKDDTKKEDTKKEDTKAEAKVPLPDSAKAKKVTFDPNYSGAKAKEAEYLNEYWRKGEGSFETLKRSGFTLTGSATGK